jgi:hypothetical protein
MLYCTVGDLDNHPMEFQWHVGEVPMWAAEKYMNHLRNWTVEIQADGDELDEIYLQFPNIPQANKSRVVNWTGDFARFIALNLRP